MESSIELQNQPALHLTTILQRGIYEEKLQPLQPDNTGNLRPKRFNESVTSTLDLGSAHPEVQNFCQGAHKTGGAKQKAGQRIPERFGNVSSGLCNRSNSAEYRGC